MNARQRRRFKRQGTSFVKRLVDVLRPLEAKIVNDPEGARRDFAEIINGVDELFSVHPKELSK